MSLNENIEYLSSFVCKEAGYNESLITEIITEISVLILLETKKKIEQRGRVMRTLSVISNDN